MSLTPHLSRIVRSSVCSSCRRHLQRDQTRTLSSTTRLRADEPASSSPSSPSPPASRTAPPAPKPAVDGLGTDVYAQLLNSAKRVGQGAAPSYSHPQRSTENLMSNIKSAEAFSAFLPAGRDGARLRERLHRPRDEPHHMHIYATKHNTHITLTRPNRTPLLSYSTGNIGFKKGQRGKYDPAFQLAAYVMRLINDKGLLRKYDPQQWREDVANAATEAGTGTAAVIDVPIQKLDLVLRGFGQGRDAAVKALLGSEGRELRKRIVSVSDSTRLKFGGTRSPKPKRR